MLTRLERTAFCIAVLFVASGAFSVEPPSASTKPKSKTEATGGVSSTTASATPVPNQAEEMLRALQSRRAASAVIPPVGTVDMATLRAKTALWPEGSVAIDRPGMLRREETGWRFHWTDASHDPPLKLLPNATLEEMVRITEASEVPPVMIVSGEMTVYGGENHLLAGVAMRASRAAAAPQNPATVVEPTTRNDAPVDDVLELLRSQQPPQKLVSMESSSSAASPNTKPMHRPAPLMNGTPIIHRPGRLIPGGSGWSLVFESDHSERPEPPMTVLPNRNLELMVKMSQRDTSGLVFVVSGEATAYGGENFLLVRMAVRRPETSNFRR